METSKFTVFDNFGVTSVMLPYIGYAHNSFLLISSLWKSSRSKLDEYYPEFRKIIAKDIKQVKIDQSTLHLSKLPWDLFELKFIIDEKSCL